MSEKAVYHLLTNASVVTDIVGTQIYALVAPRNIRPDYIVYQRISGARWRSMDGPSGMAQPRIQVSAFSDTYEGAKALADAIRSTLDGYRGVADGVRVGGVSLETDEDMYENDVDPKLYRVNMDFLVTHDE